MSGPETFILVDRPKGAMKVVSVLVWMVASFLMYKVFAEPPESRWVVFGVVTIFCACSYAVLREFLLRPTRRTAIHARERRIVIQETAWRLNREVVGSIGPDTRFEIFECDTDNNVAYGVRVKSAREGWITVADFVKKSHAERLARDANRALHDPQ
jgi:hypothetical protein